MAKRYNQAAITAVVDGIPISGLHEGASCVIRPKGGEVVLTEGTDGPGANRATDQGGEIEITLRENSPAIAALEALRAVQAMSSLASVLVLFTGVQAIATLTDCLVSRPGELSTGDKKMAGRKFTFTGLTLIETAPL
jgi:hypothetical protein